MLVINVGLVIRSLIKMIPENLNIGALLTRHDAIVHSINVTM